MSVSSPGASGQGCTASTYPLLGDRPSAYSLGIWKSHSAVAEFNDILVLFSGDPSAGHSDSPSSSQLSSVCLTAVACLPGAIWCPVSCTLVCTCLLFPDTWTQTGSRTRHVSFQTLTKKQRSQPRAEGPSSHSKAKTEARFLL